MTEHLHSSLHPPDDDGETVVFYVDREVIAVHEKGDPDDTSMYLGKLGQTHYWAVDVDGDGVPDGFVSMPLMGLYGSVDEPTWTLAGRAVQLVEWERTHRYCGRCATPTEQVSNERAKRCPSCGLMAFPRLSPAIITLVTNDAGEALLARGRAFPVPMYSCLAGFVEPGETIEGAVHREVREEVGVEVDDLRYHSSQPWPFPHSLMIGFTARHAGGEIDIDPNEIVDAAWFAPDDLPTIPPGLSIARTLIDAWTNGSLEP